jgi:hypothetical protein
MALETGFKMKMVDRCVFGTMQPSLRGLDTGTYKMYAIFLIDISAGKHPLGRQMRW